MASKCREGLAHIPSLPIFIQNDQTLVICEAFRIKVCLDNEGRWPILGGVACPPKSQRFSKYISILYLNVELDGIEQSAPVTSTVPCRPGRADGGDVTYPAVHSRGLGALGE